jgi:hypothetical protein
VLVRLEDADEALGGVRGAERAPQRNGAPSGALGSLSRVLYREKNRDL